MKTTIISFLLPVLVCCAESKQTVQPGKPPAVYALDATALEHNKKSVAAGDEKLKESYKRLIKDADKALQTPLVSVMEKKGMPPSGDKHDYMSLAPYFWPDPSKPDGLPYIRKDGQTNPEVKEYKDKEYMPALCDDVLTLGLAYYFSDNGAYAQHAADLLRNWFLNPATRMNPNLNYAQAIKGVNDGRGAGLIDSRHFIKVIDGIQLIKGSKYWKDEDQQGMQKWFSDFLNWMQTSKNGIAELNAKNNHGAWYDAQRLSMALFTGNNDLAKKIAENAAGRLDKQMDESGAFPAEMERTISLHYTVFAMEAFFKIAQMSGQTGFDFRNNTTPSGKSLKKAFDTVKPYLLKQKEWSGEQIKDFDYEEGYYLLMEAAAHFNCNDCRQGVQQLAGEKANRLRLLLLYN